MEGPPAERTCQEKLKGELVISRHKRGGKTPKV